MVVGGWNGLEWMCGEGVVEWDSCTGMLGAVLYAAVLPHVPVVP